METPGSQSSLHRANLERVVRAVRMAGSLTQAEIARTTGLSAATVSNIVRELKDGGTVEVTPTSAGGRRARSVSLSGDAGIVIGVDFGHTHLRVAVGNLAHQVLAEEAEPLDVDASSAQGFDRAEQLVSRLIAATGIGPDKVIGVGLGVPGPIDVESGTLGSTVDPAGLDRHQPARGARRAARRARVRRQRRQPRRARRAGLGQRPRGQRPRVHQGRQRCRRRSGDQTARSTAAPAARPARSATSRWTSRARSAAAATAAAWRPSPRPATCCRCCSPATAPDLTMERVVQLAREGDPGCRRVIADVGRHIGSGVANLCNLLNPSRVVLGGDLAEAGELVLGPDPRVGRAVRDPQRGTPAVGAARGARRRGPRCWAHWPSCSARWAIRPFWTELACPSRRRTCLHLDNEWHRCHLVKDLLLDV